MDFSLLSYNTLNNKGFEKINKLIDQYHPDIICVQEVITGEKNLALLKKENYKLADFSNSFINYGNIYGVATFYNPKRFRFLSSSSFKLGNNIQEMLFTLFQILIGFKKPKSILRTDFIDRQSKKKIVVCNIHLYVIAPNHLRISHLNQALRTIDINGQKNLIITGDFNYYPYQRKKLEKLMKKYNLSEATKNISQTIDFSYKNFLHTLTFFQKVAFYIRKRWKFLYKLTDQLKIDYIFYRGLKLKKTERIEVKYSDHYPIVSTFEA